MLVSGCHPSDCHYNNANQHTARRVETFWKKMDRLELNKNRLRLAWVSAAEGAQFAKVIKEMEETVRSLTPEEREAFMAKLSKAKQKKSESS